MLFRYNLMYEQQAGGAISVTSTLFQLLNGFSNSFYGKLSKRTRNVPLFTATLRWRNFFE